MAVRVLPASKPAPWGGRSGALRFPFANNWVFPGNADICADFVFTGGILASQNTWTSSTGWYQLDGFGTVL
jgi:hypothetical protein